MNPLSEKQAAFRAMIAEASPLQGRVRELGLEQIKLGYEINLLIAREEFPTALVRDAAQTMQGDLLPSDCVASPHDIPSHSTAPGQKWKWAMASLTPRDAGHAARTICEYLKVAGVEPSEIHLQATMFRVLLVR